MYPLNVVKPVGKSSPGAAAAKDPNVVIVAVKDILSWPVRDSKKVKMLGNFVLKPNAKMYTIYMTSSKIKAMYETEGEEDNITFKPGFEGEHPGDELEINEAIAYWVGEPCIIIHGSCADAFRKVVGSKCAPLQLKPAGQNDNDARKAMLKFESFVKTDLLPGHYTGAIVVSAPFAVVDAGAVEPETGNGYVYKLPVQAVTEAIIFNEVDLEHGDIISLIGSGGAGPSTLSTGVTDKKALLKAGTTWVALENAVINLQVFKTDALTLFIEVSRG